MGLKPYSSFSTGELNPKLNDRVTLERYNKALETCRNTLISKTASMMSRFATAHFVKSKNNGEAIKLYSPPNSGRLTEWGNLYVRVYDFDGTLLHDVVSPFVEADLPNMNFEAGGDNSHYAVGGKNFYIFVTGKASQKFDYINGQFDPLSFLRASTSPGPVMVTVVGPPTGYAVDYAFTLVYDGEELGEYVVTGGPFSLPILAGESNTINIAFTGGAAVQDEYTEVRVYRRPNGGGAFGYLGSTNAFTVAGADLTCSFIDLGSLADFTNGLPSIITQNGLGGDLIQNYTFKTGVIYQQRLLMAPDADDEAILASRPGYQDNFYRDFPYDADSSLKFKSGASGNAKVLKMIENDGLIVFTSIGVYIHLGLLTIDNLGLERKGNWKIKETVPPLAVPGGVFFVDTNNKIRQFLYSDSIATYQSIDHSVFSNHLFEKRTIVSWAYQDGVIPLIIVVFSDGKFATLTYDYEHQMRAWTRHDSEYPIEQVEGTGIADSTFFVVNKDGNRYITVSLPREVPADTYEDNPEFNKLSLNTFMDAVTTKSVLLNEKVLTTSFTLTPVVAGDWEGNLTLVSSAVGLFTVPGLGEVGTMFRFFDENDQTAVDLEVMARTDDFTVTVRPSCEFPSDQATGFRLYETFNQVTGLTHLEGETVGVVVDGAVLASPNNDAEEYTTVTVSGGVIDLPENVRGAIIIVGRPITADIKTLEISTVEQKPTMIESLTVNKIYIRVHETRGLYISNKFPEEEDGEKDGSTVEGMEDLDIFFVPDGYDITGNKPKQPVSKRIEKTLPGSWKSSGKVSIRQVDPIHFEILSIVPDVEILSRSDR